jgi:hypothetical protein
MSTPNRKRLSDVLSNAQALAKVWASTEAAGQLTPLPPGEYRCRVVSGKLFESRNGNPGYKVTLQVANGDHVGRKLWHEVYLTQAALPMAKRDLGKLGITELAQLERPLPTGILLDVKVTIRKNNDGVEFPAIRSITAAGVEADPFGPPAEDEDDDQDEADAANEADKPKGPAGPPAGRGSGPYGRGGDRR